MDATGMISEYFSKLLKEELLDKHFWSGSSRLRSFNELGIRPQMWLVLVDVVAGHFVLSSSY